MPSFQNKGSYFTAIKITFHNVFGIIRRTFRKKKVYTKQNYRTVEHRPQSEDCVLRKQTHSISKQISYLSGKLSVGRPILRWHHQHTLEEGGDRSDIGRIHEMMKKISTQPYNIKINKSFDMPLENHEGENVNVVLKLSSLLTL
jgi:hypothetical protein